MTNINTKQRWIKENIERNKLLETYRQTIKPILLEYYNLTGEDITLMIDDSIYNTTLYFKDGNRLEYVSSQYHDAKPSSDMNIHNTSEYPDTSYLNLDSHCIEPNIKVIKVFIDHWDKILSHMDTIVNKWYNTKEH